MTIIISGKAKCCALGLQWLILSFSQKNTRIIRVERDEVFIEQMVTNLQDFFNSAFRPALLGKYFAHDYFDNIVCKCTRFNKNVTA